MLRQNVATLTIRGGGILLSSVYIAQTACGGFFRLTLPPFVGADGVQIALRRQK